MSLQSKSYKHVGYELVAEINFTVCNMDGKIFSYRLEFQKNTFLNEKSCLDSYLPTQLCISINSLIVLVQINEPIQFKSLILFLKKSFEVFLNIKAFITFVRD